MLRSPTPKDGPTIWDLIATCPPLEQNSLYCNVLQCTHFAKSCRIAECEGQVVGWVSGYREPEDLDTLFIWQVAVNPQMRGRGLGKLLLKDVCASNPDVRRMQTTITTDNKASWALFEAFAEDARTPFAHKPHFGRTTHFGGRHATEQIVTIGPFMKKCSQENIR